jgi:deazaflavin-dependent oxidoreductase (nitroreductase family)
MTISPESGNNVMTFPDPPRGIKAKFWRMPIWIYRLGLGWLLGEKALLLTHIGRKSGLPRQAVLEIIHAYPSENRYLVVSGFGPGSQWYQNIKSEPRVTIQVGTKKINAVAEQLEKKLAGDAIIAYAQKFPGNLKTLSRILGYEIDHSPAGYRAFGEQIPVLQFSPDADQNSRK